MNLLRLSEVSVRLGVCEQTARRIVREWPAVLVGKRRRWPEESVIGFLERGGCSSPPNTSRPE
jgi:hypothetical protein